MMEQKRSQPYLSGEEKWKNLPIFAFSSRFCLFLPDFFHLFPDFWQIFRCQGGTLPPLPPQWLHHCDGVIILGSNPRIKYCNLAIVDQIFTRNHDVGQYFVVKGHSKLEIWVESHQQVIDKTEIAQFRTWGIFIRDTAYSIMNQWNIRSYFIKPQLNIPYSVWKYLTSGTL